jgi:hypothetical protein
MADGVLVRGARIEHYRRRAPWIFPPPRQLGSIDPLHVGKFPGGEPPDDLERERASGHRRDRGTHQQGNNDRSQQDPEPAPGLAARPAPPPGAIVFVLVGRCGPHHADLRFHHFQANVIQAIQS